MKDLGISKGEWIADLRGGCCAVYLKEFESDTNGCHLRDNRNILYSDKGAYCNIDHWTMSEEMQNNAELFADAGNTANKCGLLPSELLEQRDNLLEVAKSCKETMHILFVELKKEDVILRHEVSSRLEQINKYVTS